MFTAPRSLAVVVGMLASLCVAAPATAPATQPASDPFAQFVAELHARGEPATPEDLRPAAVKAEDNAAILYEKAAAALDPKGAGPRASSESFSDNLPYPPAWHRLAAENARRHVASFDLVRHAATRPAVAWTALPAETRQTGMNQQRNLANAVADAALYSHFTGNDRDAIILLREQLRHADAVGQFSKVMMVGWFTGAANNAQILSTQLTVTDSKHPLRAGVQSPASRAAVQEVIGELLNDSRLLSPWRQYFWVVRVQVIEQFRKNGLASAPQAAKSLHAMSAFFNAYAAAADKPSWVSRNVVAPDDPLFKTIFNFSEFQENNTTYFQRDVTRALLTRRMAAVSLAVALYRNDQGQFPPDLTALVPQYLPAVPVDPFSRNGQAIQYAAIDGNRPMIGSVGPDGRDDTLPQVGLPLNARYSFYFTKAGEPDDVWLDLSAWPGK